LTGAIARRSVGQDVGVLLGLPKNGVVVVGTLEEALANPPDVLVDYTSPDSVKHRVLEALVRGIRVVIGTSGLTAADYRDIEQMATEKRLGVIAAGNFSLTAALAKYFALIAARHLPSWEIIDYSHAEKPDAPSGNANRWSGARLGSPTLRGRMTSANHSSLLMFRFASSRLVALNLDPPILDRSTCPTPLLELGCKLQQAWFIKGKIGNNRHALATPSFCLSANSDHGGANLGGFLLR
jgi:hypothetical protein